MINVVNDRLQVEHPPMAGPLMQRVGGKSTTTKLNKHLEAIVAKLANSRFNKTIFEESAVLQAFKWDIAMENKWPVHQNQLRRKWNDGARSQEVMRSRTYKGGQ